ncbi:PREDICTED: uncharacterized protein LOC106740863, partial [Dinoponera quadriceps]|uniref:Uncharacterized protein LOC106740863 n=1 Tax=Dinoponera quadriceps TaxID=609295 RepID=A0A6P3WNS7_DINQU
MKTRHLWLEAAVALLVMTDGSCLRGVSLELIPDVVQRSQEVILQCHYDLKNEPLYTLKWYHSWYEFYRFEPSDDPATKIFNVTGIYVDPANSNQSQVTLRNVDFPLAGTFSCEVTAEALTFFMASSLKNLTVIDVPDGAPVIASKRERYDAGDMLRANCTLPPSSPVYLSFTLNDMLMETARYQMLEGPQLGEVSLTLQPFHYTNGGQLTLRCTAQIPGMYSAVSELQLGAGIREPVPEI